MDDDTAHPPTINHHRQRRGVRASLALVGLLVTIGLLAAACGGGSPGAANAGGTTTTVAPSGSSGSDSTTTTGAPSGSSGSGSSGQASQSQQLQLAQCMRSHGVPNYPDPSANGGQLQNLANSGVNTQSPAYQAARQACKQYTPAGSLTPAQSAADNAKGLEFAQCMRSHGVPNYPDPTTSPGGQPAVNLGAEGIDPSSPTFQAANQTCQKLYPGAK